MSSIAVPPQPAPDADTAPFWEATAEGRLSLCRCQSCSLWLQPPLERCRQCGGPTVFEEVDGNGTIYSYIVQRQPSVVGYVDAVPYVVALVELDEQLGLRLPARIVDVDPEETCVGLRVSCRLMALPGGPFVIPVFAPAAGDVHANTDT